MSACFNQTLGFIFSRTNFFLLVGVGATVALGLTGVEAPEQTTITNDVVTTVAAIATAVGTALIWNRYGRRDQSSNPGCYNFLMNKYSDLCLNKYFLLMLSASATASLVLYNFVFDVYKEVASSDSGSGAGVFTEEPKYAKGGSAAAIAIGLTFGFLLTGAVYANKNRIAACFSCPALSSSSRGSSKKKQRAVIVPSGDFGGSYYDIEGQYSPKH